MGHTLINSRFALWLVELVGKTFVLDLEFSSVVPTMVSLEEVELADFRGFG